MIPALAAFQAVLTPATQTPSPATYEPVLEYIQAEHPSRSLIVLSTILRMGCDRGGCKEPWAGTLPRPWLEDIRSRGVIGEFCVGGNDRCVDPDGRPIIRPDGVYVTLGTQRSCGEGCADVLVTLHLNRDGTTARSHRLYRVVQREGWVVESVTDGGRAIIN